MRRYLSVWLRRLATDRMTRAHSGAPVETAPLVIAEPVKNALRLAAVNDAAMRLGLKTGMALADAKAMYPTLTVAEAAPAADRRLLEAIADWCDRYTPLVGLDPPDGMMLDITGCAHLFGGEAALGHDIVRRLALQGLAARAAIADTVGCAWAVARFSPLPLTEREKEKNGRACVIVLPGGAREALLPLWLMALRIAPETAEGLGQAGLKRIADVIERPRAPLAARFGESFIRRIDQALGREDEPITPRLPIPAYVVERRFADPILLEADVLRTIEQLAHELARLLERRQEGARRLQVALFRTDGKVYRIEAGTGAPLREAARIRALFAERLAAAGDACDPGFGFDVIRLSAPRIERCDPIQTGLSAPDQAAELMHLVDRLGARFGLSRVSRLVPQDTHIPEFAVAALPAADDRHRRADGQYPSSAVAASVQDSLAPTRPPRLFARPEPIEAIAEVPDGPPARFRWRHVLHQVIHVEGPERIAMEWWHDRTGHALTRDYFRVESREGVRVWIYREGLYDHKGTPPKWFIHGLFA
jgi:protein ImuB